jgi:hypothetical protein
MARRKKLSQAEPVLEQPRVEEFLEMMDIAQAMQNQANEIQGELDYDKRKEDLVQRVMASNATMGRDIDRVHIEAGVERYLNNEFSFQQPKNDFSYRVASAYVNRNWFYKNILLPAGAITTATALAFGANSAIQSARLSMQESRVESTLQDSYKNYVLLKTKVQTLANASASGAGLTSSEKSAIDSSVSSARRSLSEAQVFFEEYAPQGSAGQSVTRENFNAVASQYEPIAALISQANDAVTSGSKVVDNAMKINVIAGSLDGVLSDIKSSKPSSVFMVQANEAYTSARTGVQQRNIAVAESGFNTLTQIKSNIARITSLSSELETSYNSAIASAEEGSAKNDIQKIYSSGVQSVRAADGAGLQSAVSDLKSISDVLNQEYTVYIRGGDDRMWSDPNERRNSTVYYVFVEAENAQGRKVSRKIRDVETQQVVETSQWAEMVPLAVYEKVKQDKVSDGIINTDKFAIKRRGFLTEQVVYEFNGKPLEKTNQMTEWRR